MDFGSSIKETIATIDWVEIYKQSIPALEETQGSAMIVIIVMCVIFIPLLAFGIIWGVKTKRMSILNLLLLIPPIGLAIYIFGGSFLQTYDNPYAIKGTVLKKWVSDNHGQRMISLKVDDAFNYNEKGKGEKRSVNGNEVMVDDELYQSLKIDENAILLCLPTEHCFTKLVDE